MAVGDAAVAAGMPLVDGATTPANTIDTEINRTRDFIIEFGLPDVVPIGNGGTGAPTAAQARVKLGVQETVDAVNSASSFPPDEGTLMRRGTDGRVDVGAPENPNNAATKSYVDGRINTRTTESYVDGRVATRFPANGGTMSNNLAVQGRLFLPNATPATDGYTVAYINSDGRVSRGASSERYKKFLAEIDPAELGDIWPNLTRYQMRFGDGTWRFGYIAERLAEHPDQQPFVVYADGNPESIDFIALLMAQNAQLHQAVELLAQRLDAIDGEVK